MKNIDSKSHVRGESVYLDDVPLIEGTLFACVYDSPVAHGVLRSVDISEAEKSEGVVFLICSAGGGRDLNVRRIAERVTFSGSMMPRSIMLQYSPLSAS